MYPANDKYPSPVTTGSACARGPETTVFSDIWQGFRKDQRELYPCIPYPECLTLRRTIPCPPPGGGERHGRGGYKDTYIYSCIFLEKALPAQFLSPWDGYPDSCRILTATSGYLTVRLAALAKPQTYHYRTPARLGAASCGNDHQSQPVFRGTPFPRCGSVAEDVACGFGL